MFISLFKKNLEVLPGQVFESKPVNVNGRNKMTFLAICDNAFNMTIQWSYDGATDWLNVENAVAIPGTANTLLRITLDDVFSYLRVTVQNNGAGPGNGTVSAWSLSL